MKNLIIIILMLLMASPAFCDTPASVSAAVPGDIFPYIKLESLNDSFVILPYESTSNARVTYILMTYNRPSDTDMESWVRPFKEAFDSNTMAAHYSIAMIGDIGLINGIIFNAMKAGAKAEIKKHLLVYFKDKNPYKKTFSITDDTLVYAYLIDKNGVICLAKSGKTAAKTDIEEIIKTTKKLLN